MERDDLLNISSEYIDNLKQYMICWILIPEDIFPVFEVFKSDNDRFAPSHLWPSVHSWYL